MKKNTSKKGTKVVITTDAHFPYDTDMVNSVLKAYKSGQIHRSISAIELEEARNKEWTTRIGEIIPYAELEDAHLDKILSMFEKGKFKNRLCHLKGLQQEKLRRNSKAGKLLYGK